MKQPTSHRLFVAGMLLLLANSSLGDLIVARGTSRSCVSSNLIGHVGASNGGRKIGIVIDESLSMQDTDPDNIRILAGKAIDATLVTKAQATGGKSADEVTVIGFHSDADVLYNLGDPSGASAIIDTINSDESGTFIGGGVKAAIDELTKSGTGATANRSGIVVLTDGQDNFSGLTGVQGTINEITRAGQLGIRVSFGFLSVDSSSQDPDILNAILKTGGAFASFQSAISLQSFTSQVLLHGLTGSDKSSNTTALFPGLTTSAELSQKGDNVFSYSVKAGEKYNFTITAIDKISLKATLKDATGGEVGSAQTDSAGVAAIIQTAKADGDLELVVTATGSVKSGIFSVGLQSSLGPCSNANTNSNSTVPTNTTTNTPPAQYTGGASSGLGKASVSLVCALAVVFAALL